MSLLPEDRKDCPEPPPGFFNVVRMSLGKEPATTVAWPS